MYLDRRKWVLSNTDRTWAESVQRVEIYRWILNVRLPFSQLSLFRGSCLIATCSRLCCCCCRC